MLIFSLLCACGGGGDDGGGNGGAPADFDDYFNQITGTGVTPVASLPVTGRYEYAGRVRLDLPIDGPAQQYQGLLEISIGFDAGANPVLGSVSQLANGQQVLVGVLQIDSGVLNPHAQPAVDYQFFAGLDGNLDANGTIYVIDGTLAGDLYGPQWDGIAGLVFGDITQGIIVDIFDGSFAGTLTP
ncbi:hypothetical protein [Yoonia tamlensis]|uniref:hypothetical protein n=1 Tax=Yoonia tamlensis TaxID=390270 RepID=UPI001041E80E|nr:hypothetical protein [Yoonia tamlensis]